MNLIGYIAPFKPLSFSIPVYSTGKDFYYHSLDDSFVIKKFLKINRLPYNTVKIKKIKKIKEGEVGVIVFVDKNLNVIIDKANICLYKIWSNLDEKDIGTSNLVNEIKRAALKLNIDLVKEPLGKGKSLKVKTKKSNSIHPKRYVFIKLENLKKIKVKKLKTVVNKLIVFYGKNEDELPVGFVKYLFKSTNKSITVKWIKLTGDYSTNTMEMFFHLGVFHRKTAKNVEFILISNDQVFDPVIEKMNQFGRYCLRVRKSNKRKGSQVSEKGREAQVSTPKTSKAISVSETAERSPAELKLSGIDEAIFKSKKRLKAIGVRPSKLDDLHVFLSLHNQEMAASFDMNEIVSEMEIRKDIEVNNGQVIYHF